MKEKRVRKIKEFEKFYDSCKTIFNNLGVNDKRVKMFHDQYMLCICPGSRTGGNEKRVVEIFWGSRPYEFETKGKQWKSLIETGATLFFYRNDTGDVTVSLYPAKTEFREPIENHIALYEWLDPEKLNNEGFIKSLWNDFIAYMEITSLDGKPTFYQRLRISYLRYFKHLVVEGKWNPTRFSESVKEIFKWVLTVGLSGIIIYAITIMTQPKTTETEIQLKEINKNLETVSKQLDSISKREPLLIITKIVDSIAIETGKIIKVLENEEKHR